MMAPHDQPHSGVKPEQQRHRRADGGGGGDGGEDKGGGPAATKMLQRSDTGVDLKQPKIHKTNNNNNTDECMRRQQGEAGVQRRRQQQQKQQLSPNDRKTLKAQEGRAPPSFGKMLVTQAKRAAARSNIFDFFTRLQQSYAESPPQYGNSKESKEGRPPPRKARQSLASHCRRSGRRPHNERSSSNPSSKSIALPHWGIHMPWYPIIAVTVLLVAVSLPDGTRGDDGDNFFAVNSFNVIPETTTQEFDYASRGQKKFGDKCDNTLECGFPGSICDSKKKSCQCTEDLPVTNHIDKCGKEAAVNESCFFNEQCEVKYFQTECRDNRCVCRFEMSPVWGKDGSVECKGRQDKKGNDTYLDPAMIGVLVGMALMFIIICVVLRLFSQARWRDNRTIFNTPNPRLMNVSLLRDSKLLHGQERRGSRMSVRGPSRQPSMVSLRPHSPNPSLGRMIRSKSNTRSSDSRVSDVSNCSRLLEHPSAAAVAAAAHPHAYTHSATHNSVTHHYHPHHHQQQQPQQQQQLHLLHQQNLQQHNEHVAAATKTALTSTTSPCTSLANDDDGSRTGSHGSNVSSASGRSGRSNSVAPGHPVQHGNNHHQQPHEARSQQHAHPHKEGHHGEAAHHPHHQPDANGSHQQHHQNQPASPHKPNITANPVAESVTVEIIEPDH